MFNKLNATLISTFLLGITIINLNPLLAEDSYYKRRAEGWHWYQDRKIEQQKKEEFKNKDVQSIKPLTPTQLLKTYQKELEKRLHLAMLFPTLKNVKAYQEFQKDLMERSQLFSERWMQSIYLNPQLDFTTKYPINQVGRHTYIDEENKDKRAKLKALSKSYGFFFFFKGDCPYCHTFAPIVKRFAARYGWAVKAISLDGVSLKNIQNPFLITELLKNLQLLKYQHLLPLILKHKKCFPSVTALHPKTKWNLVF